MGLAPGYLRQLLDEDIENDATACAAAKIFMHNDPSFEANVEFNCQDADKIGIGRSDGHLTDADAETGADGRKLGNIAVDAQRERRSV